MEKEKFTMTYSAPTKAERNEIEDIRKSYLPKAKENEKLEELKALDKKVKKTPKLWAYVFGVVFVLLFGFGLTMVLEWGNLILGVIISSLGVILMIANYFVYKKIFSKLKLKYKDKILSLSEELLNEKQGEN